MTRENLRRLLLAISALTVISGLIQMVVPEIELRVLSAEASVASSHFFRIVGMFMVLFGGLLWQALAAVPQERQAIFWAGLQKLGACAAVSLGVARHVFSPLALFVGGFDLLSGVLIFWYRSMDQFPGPETVAGKPEVRP